MKTALEPKDSGTEEPLGHGYVLFSNEFIAQALQLPPNWTITGIHSEPHRCPRAFVLSVSGPGLPPLTEPCHPIELSWREEPHKHICWEHEAPDRWVGFIHEFCPDCV